MASVLLTALATIRYALRPDYAESENEKGDYPSMILRNRPGYSA